jgi:hypothetical protein
VDGLRVKKTRLWIVAQKLLVMIANVPNASDFNEKGAKDMDLAKAILEKCSK